MAMTSTERSRKRRAGMTANQRTEENSYFASKRRTDLIRTLSPDGECAECHGAFDHNNLVIDHENGRHWHVQDFSPSVRVARYWKEHGEGVPLRAVCVPCSSRQGGGIRYHGAREPSRCRQPSRVAARRRRTSRIE